VTEYKGIKLKDSKEISYWLKVYCKDTRPQILENDIVLQGMVKRYYFRNKVKILLFNISIWCVVIYAIYKNMKG